MSTLVKITALCLFMLGVSISGAHAQTTRNASALSHMTWSDIINQGIARGVQVLDRAYERATESSERSRFAEAVRILRRAAVLYRPNGTSDYSECTLIEAGVSAFVYPRDSRRTIYACRGLFIENSINDVAQVLIHETMHLVGFVSECVAQAWEIHAMNTSGYGVAHGPRYRCQ